MFATARAYLTTALPEAAAADTPLPTDIQWMPPGEHHIVPDIQGQRKPIAIHVTPDLAARFAAQLHAIQQAAADGRGDVPYIDFGHLDDGPAAAEVTDLYWAGDHPKTGGIRLRVKWTQAGEDALRGRTYRRFSPGWFLDDRTLDPIGIGINLGGLVNRAAFKSIQSVVAHGGAKPTPTPMTPEDKSEITSLIAAAVKPLTDQLGALNTLGDRIGALETKASAADALPNRIQALEDRHTQTLRANAKTLVARAQASGRIPPQAEAAAKHWEDAIVANPKAADELDALPVNPVLLRAIAASAAGANNDQPKAPEPCADRWNRQRLAATN